jgi:hypothetical protein
MQQQGTALRFPARRLPSPYNPDAETHRGDDDAWLFEI